MSAASMDILSSLPDAVAAGDSRIERGMASRADANRRDFELALGRAGLERQDAKGQARELAEQMVAGAFLLPLLKELRASNRAGAPFAPTSAEKTLGGVADASLAQRLVRASDWPLVGSLAETFELHAERAQEAKRSMAEGGTR
ncbi:MAG: hypothetical protein ACKVW3_11075 [Phycisphaerales bacterium]